MYARAREQCSNNTRLAFDVHRERRVSKLIHTHMTRIMVASLHDMQVRSAGTGPTIPAH